MAKHAWVPIVVAIGCAWGALTLMRAPAPIRDVASAANSYPYPTDTLTTDDTSTETPSATLEPSPTDTPPEVTDTPVAESVSETPVADVPSDAQALTLTDPSDPTLMPTETPVVDILQCKPDQTYMIRGVTTPYTQLLLKFADRIVGGSISDANGEFAVPLTMGHEEAGTHTVAIVVRDTGTVLATMPCNVP